MRFGESLSNITIPEWKECYLNYEILKIFVSIIKEIVEAVNVCDGLIVDLQNFDRPSCLTLNNLSPAPKISQQIQTIKRQLLEKLQDYNRLFYRTYSTQADITELFYQMKVMQIEQRFQIIQKIQRRELKKEFVPIFLTYIEYAYIQISYISQMRQANLVAERKILKKHKKYAKKIVETPYPCHQKVNRMARIQQEYINKIEDLYVKQNTELESKVAREFLRLAAHNQTVSYLDYFLSGLGIGATIIVLAALIIIIQNANLSIQNNSIFSRDFPTWRGIAIFILYIWVLGFNLFCFQKYKISHRLIFKFNDHHYSTSSYMFRLAGIYTMIFMAVFLVYLLLITKIITNSTSFQSQYLVLMVWFALIFYLFMPLPIFNHQGRFYALKLIFKCIISPIMGVEFIIVWMTDQWISMTTPLRDLAYTVCYYTRLDFKNIATNPCKNSSTFQVVLLVVVIAISYRILQCIRLGFGQGKYFCTPHMANTIKYMLSLTSAVLSYFYNIVNSSNFLYAWIVFSGTSTCYSYYWDLKYDWCLLQSNSKNFLLRKYITFEPKRNYYIVIVANFIMRLAWMLTLSPNIASLFGNSNLLTFVTGSLEIIRRGIWNLLRVEREHLANCNEFKAIPDMKGIEGCLQTQQEVTQLDIIAQNNSNQIVTLRDTIKKEFISLIKMKIEARDQQEKQYNNQYEDIQIQQINKIKKKLKKMAAKLKGQS